jgi:hypothetical protein
VTNPEGADELAASLDLLLAGSAVGVAERVMPNVSWSRFALNLARQPRTLRSRASSLIQELVSIAEGHSEIHPAKGDKRFNDAAREGNPLLKRSMQTYLATIELPRQRQPGTDGAHRTGFLVAGRLRVGLWAQGEHDFVVRGAVFQ